MPLRSNTSKPPSFNIRSVESCTAATISAGMAASAVSFNIRSVESCTAARHRQLERRMDVGVSIFALSNRVLLPGWALKLVYVWKCFNIRSVESCTAAALNTYQESDSTLFQYSLCRIVYCCSTFSLPPGRHHTVSIFALSNRVLLLADHIATYLAIYCFNIRSVESCTAAPGVANQ